MSQRELASRSKQSADEDSPRQGEEAAATAEMLPTPVDQHKKRKAVGDPVSLQSMKRANDSGDSGGEDAAFLEGLSAEEIAKMSRSERKRHREKKRRSDVNKGFDELMTLLLEIDPRVRAEAEERARRGQWKGQLGAHEDNLLSRVDLISRTVEVLRRINKENEERKLIIASLTRGRGDIGAGVGPGAGAGFASLDGNIFGAPLAGAGDEAARVMSSGNPADALASLRAAAESRQLYNQALLNRIAASQQQQTSLLRHDLFGFPQSSHLQTVSPREMLALAASSRNAPGASVSLAYLGDPMAAGGSPPASSSANSALTRHYLQLLQSRQDAMGGFVAPDDIGKPSGGVNEDDR